MFDIAIYGSGFAGYAVAASALERGQSVVVVEKGPRDDPRTSVDLARVESVWDQVESGGFDFGRADLNEFSRVPRYLGLGGTSTIWSGKWRRLDAIDFARRSDMRSWPMRAADLEPYYARIAARFRFSLDEGVDFAAIRADAARTGLRLAHISLPKMPARLNDEWTRLEANPRLTIHANANELHFQVERDQLEASRFRRRPADGWEEITAAHHVVAAGGIASAVLVRMLQGTAKGRWPPFLDGYMDHPKGDVGRLKPRKHLDDLDRLLEAQREGVLYGICLPEDELFEGSIGNHTLFLWGAPRGREIGTGRLRGRNIRLVLNAEQFPEDWNGVVFPDGKVQWRISGDTRRDIDRFLGRIVPRIEAHFGKVSRSTWISLRGASHPAGCTPYSEAPGMGELHGDGRIEGLSNAFCVSSAAFPFSGSANPTLTVAALGNRLAERLASA